MTNITDIEFCEAQFSLDCDFMRKSVESSPEDTPPLLIATTAERKINLISLIDGPDVFRNKFSRHRLVAKIRGEILGKPAIYCAFVSEGWMVSGKDVKDLGIPPSQHPNRVEIVSIVAAWVGRDGEVGLHRKQYRIERFGDRRECFEERACELEPDSMSGPVVEMVKGVIAGVQ